MAHTLRRFLILGVWFLNPDLVHTPMIVLKRLKQCKQRKQRYCSIFTRNPQHENDDDDDGHLFSVFVPQTHSHSCPYLQFHHFLPLFTNLYHHTTFWTRAKHHRIVYCCCLQLEQQRPEIPNPKPQTPFSRHIHSGVDAAAEPSTSSTAVSSSFPPSFSLPSYARPSRASREPGLVPLFVKVSIVYCYCLCNLTITRRSRMSIHTITIDSLLLFLAQFFSSLAHGRRECLENGLGVFPADTRVGNGYAVFETGFAFGWDLLVSWTKAHRVSILMFCSRGKNQADAFP